MKIEQVKGNTYVIEAAELIPIYKTDEEHFIFLDTGFSWEREALDETLAEYGLTPSGVLGSHAHIDHSGNHGYYREKYGIPVAFTIGEAGMCASDCCLKGNYHMFNPNFLKDNPTYSEMVTKTDVIIDTDKEGFAFCGAEFTIVPAPGHSVDQIAVITPDNVMYVADACLTVEELSNIKIPYNLSISGVLKSLDVIERYKCDKYIFAHYGVEDELESPVKAYKEKICKVLDDIYGIIEGEMTETELIKALCEKYGMLSSNPARTPLYFRLTKSCFDYLVDQGRLKVTGHRGITYYSKD